MYKNKKVFAIINCKESFNDKKQLSKAKKKQFEETLKEIEELEYGEGYFDKPILINTLDVFESSDIIDEIYLIVDEKEDEKIRNLVKEYKISKVEDFVLADNLRQYSMEEALYQIAKTDKKPQFLITHDARVPFISEDTILEITEGMHKNMAAAYGVPLKDSVKKVNLESMKIEEKIGVIELWETQFPKMFLSGILMSAYDYAEEFNLYSEDDSTLIEYMRFPIKVLKGSSNNLMLDISIFDTLNRVFSKKQNLKSKI